MADVHRLETISAPVLPVDADLIELIRNLLKMAEDGKIQGIAYVTIESPGVGAYTAVGSGFGGQGLHSNIHTMIGAGVVLQQRLLALEAD